MLELCCNLLPFRANCLILLAEMNKSPTEFEKAGTQQFSLMKCVDVKKEGLFGSRRDKVKRQLQLSF